MKASFPEYKTSRLGNFKESGRYREFLNPHPANREISYKVTGVPPLQTKGLIRYQSTLLSAVEHLSECRKQAE